MILLFESFIVTKILKCWEDTFWFDHRIDSSARKLVRGSNISIGQMHVLSSQNSWTCVGSHGKTERDYLVVTSCDAMRLVAVENCWFYWEAELFLFWHSYNTNENSLKGRCRVKFQLETQKMNVCVLSDVQSIFLSHLAQDKFWESKCLSRFALFSSRQKKAESDWRWKRKSINGCMCNYCILVYSKLQCSILQTWPVHAWPRHEYRIGIWCASFLASSIFLLTF